MQALSISNSPGGDSDDDDDDMMIIIINLSGTTSGTPA